MGLGLPPLSMKMDPVYCSIALHHHHLATPHHHNSTVVLHECASLVAICIANSSFIIKYAQMLKPLSALQVLELLLVVFAIALCHRRIH